MPLRGFYLYVGSLTRPVRYTVETEGGVGSVVACCNPHVIVTIP